MLITDIYSKAIKAPADKSKMALMATKDLGSYIQRLPANEVLAQERHADATQMFQVLQGYGHAIVAKVKHQLHVGTLLLVRRGDWHSIYAGAEGMTLLTMYGPNKHSVELGGSGEKI